MKTWYPSVSFCNGDSRLIAQAAQACGATLLAVGGLAFADITEQERGITTGDVFYVFVMRCSELYTVGERMHEIEQYVKELEKEQRTTQAEYLGEQGMRVRIRTDAYQGSPDIGEEGTILEREGNSLHLSLDHPVFKDGRWSNAVWVQREDIDILSSPFPFLAS